MVAVELELVGPVSVVLEVMQQTTMRPHLETQADARHLVLITQAAVAAAPVTWEVLVQLTAQVQSVELVVSEKTHTSLERSLLMLGAAQVDSFNRGHVESVVLAAVAQVAPAV